MRSRLEAGYAQWLDSWGCKWEYEPCAFASESGQYLPDFLLPELRLSWRKEPVRGYIEVKPTREAAGDALIRQMLVIRESEPDALLFVQYPHQAFPPDPLHACIYKVSHLPPVGHVWQRMPWVQAPGSDADCQMPRLMVGNLIPDSAGPWSGDYWKVK
jgi:hypothetical protein